MAYTLKKYDCGESIEYEYCYKGRYGAKGEKRARREKATPEQIARQNQTNRKNYYRRMIKANFDRYDLWTTLKLPQGTRLPWEKTKKLFSSFRSEMRARYKKEGESLRFIYRVEIGKRGGIHMHILINRVWKLHTDILITDVWSKVLRKTLGDDVRTEGLADYTPLYESGGYDSLAAYLTKAPPPESEEYEQLSLFPKEEQKSLLAVNSSRNLIRPKPEIQIRSHWTVKGIIRDGPKPTPGYAIDKESIVCGVNPYTGMSYYRYSESLIRGRPEERWQM